MINFLYELSFKLGWFASPIFSRTGNYPQVMIDQIGMNSRLEGFPVSRSRLPKLSRKWIEYIRGTADFLGLNYYSSQMVEDSTSFPSPSYKRDKGVNETGDPTWKSSAIKGMYIVPQGLRDLLRCVQIDFEMSMEFHLFS